MNQSELVGLIRGKIQDAVLVDRQVRHPIRVLGRVDVPVRVPVRIASLVINIVHQLVRCRVIGWHRRAVAVKGVEHARTRVDFNRLSR